MARALVLLLLLAAPALASDLRVPADVVSVYDGDTFTVDVYPWPGMTMRVSVRVDGIDTPEIRGAREEEKALARRAKEAAIEALGSKVLLAGIKRGKYAGRVVARVTTEGGDDLAALLIDMGLGRPYDGGAREGWC